MTYYDHLTLVKNTVPVADIGLVKNPYDVYFTANRRAL